MKLSGWGRFPVRDCKVVSPTSDAAVSELVQTGSSIARGNGRGYGDCALNPRLTLDMRKMNRMLAFDPAEGVLTVEAGVLLSEIIETFLPRGWFPYVTPGTKFVTVGGMIAADVHGKNHHRDGSVGRFIEWIDLVGGDGQLRRCSRNENADLFTWTISGMGLTGVVLRAALRLRPVESGWIRQTTVPARDLAEAISIFEESLHATYSVAWIDCLASGARLGRSLVMLGEHATLDELPESERASRWAERPKKNLSVPIDLPSGLLNRFTVGAFNSAYYWNGRRTAGTRLVDWDTYFYPLDAIGHWNRIYGARGFAQFQCALPLETSATGLRELLDAIGKAGAGSFLAVLKRFGPRGEGISFPMPGYTLALDIPASAGGLHLLDRLDEIALAHGGRFYLAKDSRMGASVFQQSEDRADQFRALRDAQGLSDRFVSVQSERLGL